MGEETIKKILRNLKLTQMEAEVYIFLSKHGVLKCLEIARGMKRHKAQIYRILKILQTKGLVESTLEAPSRFTAVPFETVLDLSIKAKRDEAVQMENTKNEILSYWRTIKQPKLESSLEKFVVIEGNAKIYPKISQMIKETKTRLSAVATVAGLLRADQFGLFDTIIAHPLKTIIEFRFLADLSDQNSDSLKSLLKRVQGNSLNIKGRSADLVSNLSPRMIVRDGEEALFFITPRDKFATRKDEVGLWTDCRELVLAFTGIFEEMWLHASDIEERIATRETSKLPEAHAIFEREEAKKRYTEILRSAEKEILLMTSARGLLDISQNTWIIDEPLRRGVSLRIMAPVIDENQEAAKQLSECCQIRHITFGDLGTTIIDGQHLFQFKNMQIDQDISKPLNFGNAYYSDDFEYIDKMKMTLEDLWKKAPSPSYTKWELSFGPLGRRDPFSTLAPNLKGTNTGATHEELSENDDLGQTRVPSMEFVRERIRHYDRTNEPIVAYGWMARAILRLPVVQKMPLICVAVIHFDDKSAFGGGSFLEFSLWNETPSGSSFVPVALMMNRQGAMVMQSIYAGTPASQNIVLIEPHKELEVFRKGNTVFAGWTAYIPLPPTENNLGPSCLMFDGHGPIQQKTRSTSFPSGYRTALDYKVSHAFVTFMNESQPYVLSGIQGHLINEYVMKTTKP